VTAIGGITQRKSMSEKNIVNLAMMAATKLGARLFRNNTGTGWAGDKVVHLKDKVIIENPRPLRAGLMKGSSDLIGWTPITIDYHMVGKTIAVFTAMECKTPTGRVSEDQKIFIGNVEQANGIVGVIRSDDDVAKEIAKWKEKNCCS
jgi:hypothetical protein